MAFLVYSITHIATGKRYIGATTRSLRERWSYHLQSVKRGEKFAIHRAILEHGPDAFKMELIHEALTRESMFEIERRFISEMNTRVHNGFNLTDGGLGSTGLRLTEEQRDRYFESQWKKGRERTPEHRQKISEGLKAARASSAYVSNHRCGQKNSEEHKRKISEAIKRKYSEDPNYRPYKSRE